MTTSAPKPTSPGPSPEEEGAQVDSLPAHTVIALVREWVETDAAHLPNFAGAYLWGGITALEADAPFKLWRDLDVVVVLTEGAPEDEGEVFYKGLSIEIIHKNLDEHYDADAALANPSAGPNLAATTILADPTGALTLLQQRVAAAFAQPRWIAARVDAEARDAQAALDAMVAADRLAADTPAQRMDAVRNVLSALSGMLAVAQLARPTTRRTIALLGELLAAQGRPDLLEEALQVMGSASMTEVGVRALLDDALNGVARAAQVYQTPIPYGFALRTHLLPYYREGALEMIDEGQHREAMYWVSCLDTAYLALANDAPDAEKPLWAQRLGRLYASLGLTDDAAWPARVALAESLTRAISLLANQVLAKTPNE